METLQNFFERRINSVMWYAGLSMLILPWVLSGKTTFWDIWVLISHNGIGAFVASIANSISFQAPLEGIFSLFFIPLFCLVIASICWAVIFSYLCILCIPKDQWSSRGKANIIDWFGRFLLASWCTFGLAFLGIWVSHWAFASSQNLGMLAVAGIGVFGTIILTGTIPAGIKLFRKCSSEYSSLS